VRFLSLVAAAVCGAIGATCLLSSGTGAMLLTPGGMSGASEADIGIGGDTVSPFQVDDSANAWSGGTGLPPIQDWMDTASAVWSLGEQTAEVRRDDGIAAQFASNTKAPAARGPAVGSKTNSGWVVVANSAEGRPLHLKTIGSGAAKTLVVAGLDGEDRIAVNWIDYFVQQLNQSPDALRDYQVLLLRAANPDGLTAKHHENGRGVALNRNFPTANFRPKGNPNAGTGPASEPETRAVMQLLYDLKPQRIVHVVSTSSPSDALCNGVAAEASSSLQDVAGLSVDSLEPREHGGSLEDFATTVLGIEVVTLRLRSGEDWRSAAVSHYPVFVAASIPQTHRGELAQSTRSKSRRANLDGNDESPISATSAEPVTRRKPSGYEELPPPPNKRGR
jgi:protein MpaA